MPKTRVKQHGDKTIVFLPFDQNKTGAHLASSKAWNGIDASDVICNDSATKHAKLGALMGQSDVLYIRGHCSAGSNDLEADGDHSETITAEDLAIELSAHLPQLFPGIIKLYGCSTSRGWGYSNVLLIGNVLYWDSFAQKFADKMWELGYKRCSIYAYDESVPTHSKGAGNHKTLNDGSGRRASGVRKMIIPRMPDGNLLPL